MSNTFYVTTPIYYANGAPHLGSLYTTIVADALARFHRQCGEETFFLTGTDEHGINIQRKAIERGLAPKQYVDEIVAEFERVFADFHLDSAHGGYDIFMRTTNAFHYAGVSHLWRTVRASKTPNGNEPIYKGFYEGWFCAACAAYKTEDEYAKPENAGDPPTCLIHLTALDRVAEESYFFRLSDYAETLLEIYAREPFLIQPEARRNEVISFIKSGLQDLSISRPAASIKWGIPVPDDATHTIYVWFDALSNYITAIGYGNSEREAAKGFEKFWENATHLVGNDILRFHTVYWHSFLLAANLKLPKTVYAHGMWLDGEGRKWSKTLGNAIYPNDLKPYFSIDTIRYFVLRQMVFGQDGRMSYESIIERANGDLASGLGNLASRTLTMINRYFGGEIPGGNITEATYLTAKRAGVQPDALEFASAIELARDGYVRHFEAFEFSRALETAWSVIARTDKFISDAKPWELAKDAANSETLGVVLYRAAETLRWLAVMLAPVMPDAMTALWKQIGLDDKSGSESNRETNSPLKVDARKLLWGELKEGTKTGAVENLFPRLDKTKIMSDVEHNTKAAAVAAAIASQPVEKESVIAAQTGNQINDTANTAAEASNAAQASRATTNIATTNIDAATNVNQSGDAQAKASEVEGVASFITIDDFLKVEMRVGQILTAERVPKADKLLRFTVDVGEAAPRQILAGIAEHYEPETLINRKIAVVSNLAPRKLRGFESQGMILAASVEGGRPVLATFTEEVPNGAKLK